MIGLDNLPPRPWSWEDQGATDRPMGTGFVYLLDANGRKIGTFWGKAKEKVATADLVAGAAEMHTALVAASRALRSYQFGNTATDLAKEIADACDEAIAKAEGRAS